MITLKQAIKLANQSFLESDTEYMKSRRITGASEFKKGWWLSFNDCEWGGLLFVVKETGDVLWGNPPPLDYLEKEESPREVPDKEFHEAAGY